MVRYGHVQPPTKVRSDLSALTVGPCCKDKDEDEDEDEDKDKDKDKD